MNAQIARKLVDAWFAHWAAGTPELLPLAEHFTHTSPYGTIEGKAAYMALVNANRKQFLGNRFEVLDVLAGANSVCVRYTMHTPTFSMDVSEWFYTSGNTIESVLSYYNIEGEIGSDRSLKQPS